MKKTFLWLILALLTTFSSVAEEWSQEELRAANTAAKCDLLTDVEKEVVMYVNLARMYPQKFARLEVTPNPSSSYVTSLISDLNALTPLHPLTIRRDLIDYATCWAKESGEQGIIGHQRITCPEIEIPGGSGMWGENCSYGKSTARDIVLQLLIDEGTTSLGHRKNILKTKFYSIGVSVRPHARYRTCCVQDFLSTPGESYVEENHDSVVEKMDSDTIHEVVITDTVGIFRAKPNAKTRPVILKRY